MNKIEIDQLKREYRIKFKSTSSDKDHRRVAILISDELLIQGYEINQIPVIEELIYQEAKKLSLACDSIPEEIRISQLPKAKRGNFEPLKLWSDRMKVDLDNMELPESINQIISQLAMEVENGGNESRENGNTENLECKPISKLL